MHKVDAMMTKIQNPRSPTKRYRSDTGTTHESQFQVRRFEFPGEREVIRDRSVKAALQMLRFVLLGVSDTPLVWEVARQA